MATTDPIIIESYSDNVTRLSDAFDAKDLSGVKDILGDGSNLYNLIDYLLQERPHLHERWRDVDIDPTQFISQALEDFRNNNVDSDSVLGNRLETMLNEINSAADLTQNTSTEISFTGANGSSFALLGNNFGTGANLNTLLDAIAGGASPTDAFFTTLGGQVTSLKLNDSASGTSFGIELNNTETTQNDAETIAFDLGGLKLAFDGSFPRDIATIYTWAKSGAGVQSFLQQESVLVDAFRIEFPNNKLFEVSKDGITLTIPYSSTTDPANTGEEYALQFKLAGDFDEVMKQLPWSTDLTNLQLDGMSLSEFSFSDVILYDDNSANDGAVKTVQDQIALKMTDTQWSFNIDELMLIFEGSPGNTFLDFKEMGDKELSQIFSEARITTEALEAKNEELVKAEFVTGPVTVGGIAIAPGDEVVDLSAIQQGVDLAEVVGVYDSQANVIGTAYDDVLIAYNIGNVVDGGAGNDHIGAIEPYSWPMDPYAVTKYVGGDGADVFHIAISNTMPAVEIVDFDPTEGDRIELVPRVWDQPLSWTVEADGSIKASFQTASGSPMGTNTVVTFGSGVTATAAEIQAATSIDNTFSELNIPGPDYIVSSNITSSNSVIYGHQGDDVITGGAGDQTIYSYGGQDIIDGGAGTDTVRVAGEYELASVGKEFSLLTSATSIKLKPYIDAYSNKVVVSDQLISFDFDFVGTNEYHNVYYRAFESLAREYAKELGGSAYASTSSYGWSALDTEGEYSSVQSAYYYDYGNGTSSYYKPSWSEVSARADLIKSAFTFSDNTVLFGPSGSVDYISYPNSYDPITSDDLISFDVDTALLRSLNVYGFEVNVVDSESVHSESVYINPGVSFYDSPDGNFYAVSISRQELHSATGDIFTYRAGDWVRESTVFETPGIVDYEINFAATNTAAQVLHTLAEKYVGLNGGSYQFDSWYGDIPETQAEFDVWSSDINIYDSNNYYVSTYKPTWAEFDNLYQVVKSSVTLVDATIGFGEGYWSDVAQVKVDWQQLVDAGFERQFDFKLQAVGTEEYFWNSYTPPKSEKVFVSADSSGANSYNQLQFKVVDRDADYDYVEIYSYSHWDSRLETESNATLSFSWGSDPYRPTSAFEIIDNIISFGGSSDGNSGYGLVTPDTALIKIDRSAVESSGWTGDIQVQTSNGYSKSFYYSPASEVPFGEATYDAYALKEASVAEMLAITTSSGVVLTKDVEYVQFDDGTYVVNSDGSLSLRNLTTTELETYFRSTDLGAQWDVEFYVGTSADPIVPEWFAPQGLSLNFTDASVTLADGSSLASGYLLVHGSGAAQAMKAMAGTETSIEFTGTKQSDTVYIDDSEIGTVFIQWSPGDDTYYLDAATTNIFQSNTYATHLLQEGIGTDQGELVIDVASRLTTQGVKASATVLDMSSGDLVIKSDFGTTTVKNVDAIYDSVLSDVIKGSSGDDEFVFLAGGFDMVTGGQGVDRYIIENNPVITAANNTFGVGYLPDGTLYVGDINVVSGTVYTGLTYSTGSKVLESRYELTITDYESGEVISLEEMGFSTTGYQGELSVAYEVVGGVEQTVVSVATGSATLDDVVTLVGRYAVDTMILQSDGDLELTFVQASSKISVTDLSGATSGSLTKSSFSDFDFLDLTGLSGSVLTIETGFDKDFGSVLDPYTGDYYDFSGFEGYIVDGNATAGTGRIYFAGAEGDNEIVVVEGGHDLSIDLGLELHDVLSFRGTSDGVLVDFTDTTAEFATSSQTGWTDFSATGMSGAVYGADYLFGSDGADTFTGYADKTNILAGYGGNDTLTGGSLSDVLLGGADQDILVGGAGQDILIDLDKAKLTGGVSDKTGDDAADLFVVRGVESGTADGVTEITDYELGSNTQIYSDRIAFNISVSSLAGTALAAITPDGSLAAADYDKLKSALRVEVTPDTGTPDTDFTVQVFVKASASTALTEDLLVGQTDVSLTGDTKLTAEDRLEYRILDQEDFLSQIQQVVLDQMLYTQDALDVGGGTDYTDDGKNIQTSEAQLLDGTVNLFVALVREDKFAVTSNGEPVLIARRENGQDLTSNFRPGEGNEVILAGTASDEIQIRQIEGANPATVDFGRDTVIERGGDADAIVMPVGIAELFDLDGAGSLVPDLDLTRIQRGREGEGRSLEIKYSDSTPTADSINDVDLVVYKQYVEYDDMFRVEDLKLIDTNNTEATYQLGETTADGLMAEGKSDAVLVGRDGIDDVMLVQWDSSYTEELNFNNQLDIILTDFDAANDVVAFRGYGTDVAADIDGDSTNDGSYSDVVSWKYVDGSGATSSARTNHAEVVVNNGADTTVHLYFADGAPTLDDWLFDPVANV